MPAQLEHVNYTVTDARRTAAWLCDLFGWHIRWEGDSLAGGYSMHVGTDTHYVAIYQPREAAANRQTNYVTAGGLNHIAVTVDDIDAMEARVKQAGFVPENHADYEPGRRFYFHDHDNIEYEIVQYD